MSNYSVLPQTAEEVKDIGIRELGNYHPSEPNYITQARDFRAYKYSMLALIGMIKRQKVEAKFN